MAMAGVFVSIDVDGSLYVERGLPLVAAATSRHALSPAEAQRSEEHTSELQSLMRISYAVFCLKKKNQHSLKIARTSLNKKTNRINSTQSNTSHKHTHN